MRSSDSKRVTATRCTRPTSRWWRSIGSSLVRCLRFLGLSLLIIKMSFQRSSGPHHEIENLQH
jgi:hypothetical protein